MNPPAKLRRRDGKVRTDACAVAPASSAPRNIFHEDRITATAERIYIAILVGDLPPTASERLATKCLDEAEIFHRAVAKRFWPKQ